MREVSELTVYADILVLLNMTVDYFILAVTAAVIKKKCPVLRQLAAAGIGGVSSLYIFAPENGVLTDLLFNTAVCALMTLAAFGFRGKKQFLKAAGVLLLVTCVYGGIMIALCTLFSPRGMTVSNSVVYFNITPGILIGCSVAAYLLYFVFSAVFSSASKLAGRCRITVEAGGRSVDMNGIIDTGNSIKDVFGESEVIIADKECVKRLFGGTDPTENDTLKSRYRLMPCRTVSGDGALDGFRCDSATVSDGKKSVTLEKPILAVSGTPLNDDYQAIVNPVIFM